MARLEFHPASASRPADCHQCLHEKPHVVIVAEADQLTQAGHALIVGRSIAQGRRAAFSRVGYIGCAVHTVAAALGVSAILALWRRIFVVKLVEQRTFVLGFA